MGASGYSYFPTDPAGKKDSSQYCNVGNPTNPIIAPAEATERFDRLDRSLPYMTDSLNSRSGLAHKSGMKVDSDGKVTLVSAGVNALFADGHVVYAADKEIFTDSYWDKWGDQESNIPRTLEPSQYNIFYYRMFLLIAGNRAGLTDGRTR